MVRWSDWDFKAKRNGTIMYKLWLTPYQAPISKATGAVFADEYVRKLGNEGAVMASFSAPRSRRSVDAMW